MWCHGQKSCCDYWVQRKGHVRKENRAYTISLLSTGGVTTTKVVPFNYLHFKKDDDKLEELQRRVLIMTKGLENGLFLKVAICLTYQ